MFIIYGRKTYQGCSTKHPIILKIHEESGKVLRSLDQSYQMCLLWTKIRSVFTSDANLKGPQTQLGNLLYE